MIDLQKFKLSKRQKPTSLLGLSLDGSRLDGVVLRRANNTLQIHETFSITLSLDPLTNDPELVGREIRNGLDAAGVHEKHCVMSLPLKWALVTHATIPDLPEADVASFLQIETERAFPCDPATLVLAVSRCKASSGEQLATMVGISRNHLGVLEQILKAAQLKPASISLGIMSLQPAWADTSTGSLALVIGETHVDLQVSCGGGIAALRALDGALESEAGQRQIKTDVLVREMRITLGQLPAGLRDAVRHIRIFGPSELAGDLARELKPRFDAMGLTTEVVTAHSNGLFDAKLPSAAVVSPAFNLAALKLAGRGDVFEFMPPKVSAWQQMLTRYSSGSLQRVAVGGAAIAVCVLGLFVFQQSQLWWYGSEWGKMETRVRDLDVLQQKIRQYRPWFDESLPSMSILRQVAEAFPETGVVSAKTVEIRDRNLVTCSGIARDNQTLLKTMEKLRASKSISDLKVNQIRGKTPIQFTFDFRWNEGMQK